MRENVCGIPFSDFCTVTSFRNWSKYFSVSCVMPTSVLIVLLHTEQIIPAKCKYEVLSTKIEIRLPKAEPIHWMTLEFSKEKNVPLRINVSSGSLFSKENNNCA